MRMRRRLRRRDSRRLNPNLSNTVAEEPLCDPQQREHPRNSQPVENQLMNPEQTGTSLGRCERIEGRTGHRFAGDVGRSEDKMDGQDNR